MPTAKAARAIAQRARRSVVVLAALAVLGPGLNSVSAEHEVRPSRASHVIAGLDSAGWAWISLSTSPDGLDWSDFSGKRSRLVALDTAIDGDGFVYLAGVSAAGDLYFTQSTSPHSASFGSWNKIEADVDGVSMAYDHHSDVIRIVGFGESGAVQTWLGPYLGDFATLSEIPGTASPVTLEVTHGDVRLVESATPTRIASIDPSLASDGGYANFGDWVESPLDSTAATDPADESVVVDADGGYWVGNTSESELLLARPSAGVISATPVAAMDVSVSRMLDGNALVARVDDKGFLSVAGSETLSVEVGKWTQLRGDMSQVSIAGPPQWAEACDADYSLGCVPIHEDVVCLAEAHRGSVQSAHRVVFDGLARVTADDPHWLDRDGNGVACDEVGFTEIGHPDCHDVTRLPTGAALEVLPGSALCGHIEAGTVTIDVIGVDGFDPTLELRTLAGEIIDFDDDSGEGFNSRISATLLGQPHLVIIRSVDETEGGAVEVLVDRPSPNAAAPGPLTGIPGGTDRPALAVPIDNSRNSGPQAGLAEADVLYEVMVEGGLTRLLAVFQSTDPYVVGPIRTVRITSLDLVDPLGRPLVALSGANVFVWDRIAERVEQEQLEIVDRSTLFRSDDRRAPHDLVGSPTEVRAAHADRGGTPTPIFHYGPDRSRGARPSNGVRFDFPSTSTAYEWDGLGYVRSADRADFDPDADHPVTADNVIVQVSDYAPHPSTGFPEATTVGEGTAWIHTKGHLTVGTWQRDTSTEPIRYLDADGLEVDLTPGRTHVVLAPDGTATEL